MLARPIFFLLFALLLAIAAGGSVSAKQTIPNELLGSYLFRFEWGGTRITLKRDSSFTMETSSCTAVSTQSGPVSYSDGMLFFTTLKFTTRNYGPDEKEIDLTKRKNRKKFLDTDEPFEPDIFEIRVVRWGDRIYLADFKEFGSFIEAINLGFEPRTVDGYRALYGHIFLREGDEKKAAGGLPAIPTEYLSMLLPEPINATVISIETISGETIATLDRGSDAGLRKDLTLVLDDENFHFQGHPVVSVTNNSARVRAYGDIKVGDQLSTRIKNVLRFS